MRDSIRRRGAVELRLGHAAGKRLTPMRAMAALIAALLVLATGPKTFGSEGLGGIINCYDQDRDIVQKMLESACRGRVVSPAEAVEIEKRRRSYIQDAFSRPKVDLAPGKKLKGVGSGFFVSKDGHILTNKHVVATCDVISVAPATGGEGVARALATDGTADLALLKSDLAPAAIARFGHASMPAEAQPIALVGYPDQGIPPIRPLLTEGVTSGRSTAPWGGEVIAIKADVRPGNSGGPLLDQWGRVIGVIFAKIDTPAMFKRTGTVVRDVGFAIPLATARDFLAENQVTVVASRGSGAPADDLLESARPFVARIGCWR